MENQSVRLLLIAPFSIGDSSKEWPLLPFFQERFGLHAVDFFGIEQDSIDRHFHDAVWVMRILRRICATFQFLLKKRDDFQIILNWYSRRQMMVLYAVRLLCPSFRSSEILWIAANVTVSHGLKGYLKHWIELIGMRTADTVVCNSLGQLSRIVESFPFMKDRVCYVRYSAPVDSPESARRLACGSHDNSIFSGGYANRDYALLIRAVEGSGYPTKLVMTTALRKALSGTIPGNVEIYENLNFQAFSEMMARATIVVIPLIDPRNSSGQLVLLQALEFGKPVVIAEFEGVQDYVRHGVDALVYQPGNLVDLREKIDWLMRDHQLRHQLADNARQSYAVTYQWKNYADDLIAIALRHLGRRGGEQGGGVIDGKA